MIAIYLIGVIFLFLFLIISDQRNDIVWDACLAIGWPVVLVFISIMALIFTFGLSGEDNDDDPYRDCNR